MNRKEIEKALTVDPDAWFRRSGHVGPVRICGYGAGGYLDVEVQLVDGSWERVAPEGTESRWERQKLIATRDLTGVWEKAAVPDPGSSYSLPDQARWDQVRLEHQLKERLDGQVRPGLAKMLGVEHDPTIVRITFNVEGGWPRMRSSAEVGTPWEWVEMVVRVAQVSIGGQYVTVNVATAPGPLQEVG